MEWGNVMEGVTGDAGTSESNLDIYFQATEILLEMNSDLDIERGNVCLYCSP